MVGLPHNYTAIGSVNGQLVIIPNIDRLKAIGGGIDTRQTGPIVVGLRDLCADSPHLQAKPHAGWDAQNMAKWLTQGPLPIPDTAALPHSSGKVTPASPLLPQCLGKYLLGTGITGVHGHCHPLLISICGPSVYMPIRSQQAIEPQTIYSI